MTNYWYEYGLFEKQVRDVIKTGYLATVFCNKCGNGFGCSKTCLTNDRFVEHALMCSVPCHSCGSKEYHVEGKIKI